MDEGQEVAVKAYLEKTGRHYVPGDLVEMPIDALVFTEYQRVWLTLEQYKAERCKYDPETNDWLVYQITETLLESDIPPIYVDILPDGVAIVDGSHRLTAHLIAGHETVLAHLNKEN